MKSSKIRAGVRCDPFAGVRDGDRHAGCADVGAQFHGPMVGKFYRIIDKVEQDAREFDPVARDGHFVGGRGRQGQPFLVGRRTGLAGDLSEQLAEIDEPDLRRLVGPVEPGDLQEPVQEVGRGPGAPLDLGQRLA